MSFLRVLNIGVCVFHRITFPWCTGSQWADLTSEFMSYISFCPFAGGLLFFSDDFYSLLIFVFHHGPWWPGVGGTRDESIMFQWIHLQWQRHTPSQLSSGEIKIGEVNASTCLFPSTIKPIMLESREWESIAVHYTQNLKQH